MEFDSALSVLAALGQQTRLHAFRLLVRHAPHGLYAGEVADRLDVPANSLSTHLAILQRAGLITSERQNRKILYRVEIDTLRRLMLFLARDCCADSPELCVPLAAELARIPIPNEAAHAH